MSSQWKEWALADLFEFSSGKSIAPGGDGAFPAYGSNGLIGRSPASLFSSGIIIGRVGAYCGSVALSPRPFWASDNTIVARPRAEVIDLRFGFYLLLNTNLNSWAGGAAQPLLTQSVLKPLRFRVPSLQLQVRIASILGAYDDLIEVNRRRIALLEETARRLFEEWFVHFRFPGHEAAIEGCLPSSSVPAGWRLTPIRELGHIITGKTPSKTNPSFFGGRVPFIKIPDMHDRIFVLSTFESLSDAGAGSQPKKTLPKGALCVSCIGTIGLVVITTDTCQTNQQINSIILGDKGIGEYLFFALRSRRRLLENLGANGATIGNVNKEKFGSVEVLMPPIPLIQRYHELVSPMFSAIRTHSRAQEKLHTSREILLPRLISGEISLAAAERELEAAA